MPPSASVYSARSKPWPPLRMSLPAPPSSVSLPLSPSRVSLPLPPESTSLPSFPIIMSSPFVPVSVSSPGVSVMVAMGFLHCELRKHIDFAVGADKELVIVDLLPLSRHCCPPIEDGQPLTEWRYIC